MIFLVMDGFIPAAAAAAAAAAAHSKQQTALSTQRRD
jgi:NaMN:DMB phosphoribosyltransferase